jgi:hypothetical protein
LPEDSQLAVVNVLEIGDLDEEYLNPPIAIEHSGDELEIKFERLSDGTPFSLKFPNDATVDDARRGVAEYLGLDGKEDIELVVEGRGLIHKSLLRNAGIGDCHVTVWAFEADE